MSASMRRGVWELGLGLCLASCVACRKGADAKDQPRAGVASLASASSGPAAASASLASMMGDDSGRCVEQVVVSDQFICFQFNRGYYWCRGSYSELGPRLPKPPHYRVIPRRYERLFIGSNICGQSADRKVECWGFNDRGFLATKEKRTAVPVGLAVVPGPVEDFALCLDYFCALAGGKVYCAGGFERAPEVLGLGVVQQVGAGVAFGCASNERGVWCGGAQGDTLTVPDPTYSNRLAGPIKLPAGLRIRELHVGSVHGCVLSQDDAVYCFGNGDYASWGDGTRDVCLHANSSGCEKAMAAHYVATLGHDVRALGVGGAFSCVLKKDGSVWCWGNNGGHVISNEEHLIVEPSGNVVLEPLPLQRTDLGTDNRTLKVGLGHACVEKNNGELWCWGNNRAQQLAAEQSDFEPPRRMPLPAPRCAARKR